MKIVHSEDRMRIYVNTLLVLFEFSVHIVWIKSLTFELCNSEYWLPTVCPR